MCAVQAAISWQGHTHDSMSFQRFCPANPRVLLSTDKKTSEGKSYG